MKTIAATFICFFIVTFFSVQLLAQPSSNSDTSQILPIRENGLWGFINQRGDIINPPKYSTIQYKSAEVWGGTFNYYLVEQDGKLGMVDELGVEVLAPKFDKELTIIQKNPVTFAIPYENGIMPVDSEGEHLLNATYDEVQPINDDYFAVRLGYKWGIHRRNGDLKLPVKYYGFDFDFTKYSSYGEGYFIYFGDKKKTKLGLIDKNGKVVIPARHKGLQFIHQKYLLISKSKGYNEIYHISGKTTGMTCREAYSFISEIFRVQKSMGYYRLYNARNNKWLTPDYKYKMFFKGTGKYIIAQANRNLNGVVDTLGREIIRPKFSAIRIFNEEVGLFKVFRGGVWGISNSKDRLKLPLEYESITDLNSDSVALIIKNGKQGMINYLGEIVVEAIYDNITVSNRQITAFNGGQVTTFEATGDGKVTKIREDKDVFTLRIGYKDIVNVNRGRTSSRTTRPLFRRTPSASAPLAPDNAITNNLETFIENDLYGLREVDSKNVVLDAQFKRINRLQNANIAYIQVLRAENDLGFRRHCTVELSHDFLVYSETDRKFVEDNIVGLRTTDFLSNDYAAYIRKDGSFGLMSKDGRPKLGKDGQPEVITFIDVFQEGKARVYLGGDMRRQEFFATSPNFVGSMHDVIRPFDVKTKGSLNRCYLRLEGGKWTYLNRQGNYDSDTIFVTANRFERGLAVCKTEEGAGMINLNMDTVLGFRFIDIQPFEFDYTDSVLMVIRKNMRPIYLNKNGGAMPELNDYVRLGQFSDEGLALAMKGNKFGYVNTNLTDSIAFEYDYARPFNEGLAAVLNNKRWYFINTKGETVVAAHPKVGNVGDMHSGLAWMQVGKGFGFMSATSATAIAPKFIEVTDFNRGAAGVLVKDMFGIINVDGEYILKPSLAKIESFNELGLAKYQKAGSKRWGIVNTLGEFVTDAEYDFIGRFENGYAKVKKGYSSGMIDTTGTLVVPLKYDEVGIYSEGLVRVRPRYGKWQYINIKGEIILNKSYERAYDFENGSAIIVYETRGKDPQEVLIDTTGKHIYYTKPNETIEFFAEGVIGIKHTIIDDNKDVHIHYTLIDTNEVQIGDNYKSIQPFINGQAIVEVDKAGFGIINKRSMYIVSPKYQMLISHSDDLYRGIITKHFGLYSKAGNELIYPKFDAINNFNSSLLQFERDDKVSYLKKGLEDWVWE